jgi:hypothetical protein
MCSLAGVLAALRMLRASVKRTYAHGCSLHMRVFVMCVRAHVFSCSSECMCNLAAVLAALRMPLAGLKRTYARVCSLRMCFVVLQNACAVLQVC